jgi:hypothetical protein
MRNCIKSRGGRILAGIAEDVHADSFSSVIVGAQFVKLGPEFKMTHTTERK